MTPIVELVVRYPVEAAAQEAAATFAGVYVGLSLHFIDSESLPFWAVLFTSPDGVAGALRAATATGASA